MKGPANPWIKRVTEFIPDFMNQHEVLRHYIDRCSILLHGSTVMGVDDAFSDIDLWMIVPDEDHAEIRRQAKTDFFAFDEFHGKIGHMNAESHSEFVYRLHQSCHMDTIFQLRSACLIRDYDGLAQGLIDTARQPMSNKIRHAWFFYHYVAMRGDHRCCDNPIDRNQPVPLMLALSKTMRHAMQAAMVLDSKPYPYDKWLYQVARKGPVGSKVCQHVKEIMTLVGEKGLDQGGPESENRVSQELRAIRKILIEAADAVNINGPWLARWWEHINPAQSAIKGLSWAS